MKPFRLWLFNLITPILPETRFYAFKACFLRFCGAKVGKNVRIVSGVEIVGNGALEIGDDVFLGAHTRLCPVFPASIHIGNHCDLGPEVLILTGTHQIDRVGPHVAGNGCSKSVVIADGCWLCARSTILPGAKVKNKCIVAAGSVVKEGDYQARSLLAGVPAIEKNVHSERR